MTFRQSFYVGLLALPISIGSCSKDDGSGAFFSSASGTLSQSGATAMKTSARTAAKVSFSAPGDLPSGYTRDTAYNSCKSQEPTSTVDADSDSIPKTKK